MSIHFSRAAVVSIVSACWCVPALLASQSASAALGGAPMSAPARATATSRTITGPSTVAVLRSASSATSGAASGAATSSSSATASYTVRETTLGNGTVVREYIATSGSVFGVAWKGPQMPSLSTLLGSYFPQYVQSVTASRALRGGGHGPGVVRTSGLVVHSGGHMGAFAGQAYLPDALPTGVSGTDIN